MKNIGKKIPGLVAPILVFVILFGAWQLICVKNNIPKWLLPAPLDVFKCMFNSFADFRPHILITFKTIIVGLAAAVPFGILAATVMTSNRVADAAVSPYITLLAVTPPIALIPIMVLFFSYGQRVRVIGVFLQAFAIVTMNTRKGILNVPAGRHELMQSMGASKIQSLRHVIYPIAAPDIFTGIRLSTIFATTACIATEYFCGNGGLGAEIVTCVQSLKTTEAFACIFFATLIGLILYGLVSLLRKAIICRHA